MLAEMRAYGEGIIVAEQIPTKLSRDIIKHPDLKIMHRITADEDRQILGSAMNFSERHRQYTTTLKRGMAAVYVEGLYAPTLVQIHPPKAHKIPSVNTIFEKMAIITLSKFLNNIESRKVKAGTDLGRYLECLQNRIKVVWQISDYKTNALIQKLLAQVGKKYPSLKIISQEIIFRYKNKKE